MTCNAKLLLVLALVCALWQISSARNVDPKWIEAGLMSGIDGVKEEMARDVKNTKAKIEKEGDKMVKKGRDDDCIAGVVSASCGQLDEKFWDVESKLHDLKSDIQSSLQTENLSNDDVKACRKNYEKVLKSIKKIARDAFKDARNEFEREAKKTCP